MEVRAGAVWRVLRGQGVGAGVGQGVGYGGLWRRGGGATEARWRAGWRAG